MLLSEVTHAVPGALITTRREQIDELLKILTRFRCKDAINAGGRFVQNCLSSLTSFFPRRVFDSKKQTDLAEYLPIRVGFLINLNSNAHLVLYDKRATFFSIGRKRSTNRRGKLIGSCRQMRRSTMRKKWSTRLFTQSSTGSDSRRKSTSSRTTIFKSD